MNELKVFLIGFLPNERRLIDGVVLISQRRNPKLGLVGDDDARSADVVVVDGRDAMAMNWAASNPWLKDRPVIWVDRQGEAPSGHLAMSRPMNWPALPIALARALETKGEAASASVATASSSGVRATPGTPAVTAHRPPAGGLQQASHAPRILVVDDSLAVRNHLQSLMRSFGIELVAVESAEDGISVAGSSHFDCVLMDVLMPGIDGFEACRRIKSAARGRKGPAVVMLTSKGSSFDRIRGKMSGCDAYLTKPVDVTELKETLGRFMTLPQMDGQGRRSVPSAVEAL